MYKYWIGVKCIKYHLAIEIYKVRNRNLSFTYTFSIVIAIVIVQFKGFLLSFSLSAHCFLCFIVLFVLLFHSFSQFDSVLMLFFGFASTVIYIYSMQFFSALDFLSLMFIVQAVHSFLSFFFFLSCHSSLTLRQCDNNNEFRI